jgi:hypothetical protein
MNVRVMGNELLHADGQTDIHDEANSLFSQAPKMFDNGSNWYMT